MSSLLRTEGLQRIVLCGFAAAFILRLLWGLTIPVVPLSDSNAYDVFAQNLAEGVGYGWEPHKPSAYWPVGTSAIYAVFYYLFGHTYAPLVILHLVVGVAVVVMGWWLARRWFNDSVAAVTAWILACWPVLIQYTTVLASELFFIFFVTTAYAFASARRGGIVARGMASGLSLASANYVRPIALAMAPLLFLRDALEPARRTHAFLTLAICVIVMILAIAPWIARNWQAFDRLVVMSTNGGRILWMGNNPDADTGYMKLPQVEAENEADLDRILGRQAREYIVREPAAFLRRSIKKALVLHDRETIGVVWNEAGISRIFGASALTPLKIVSSAYWWAVLALSIYGVFALTRVHGWSLLLACPAVCAWAYFTVVHSITIAADRYHIPSAPFIAMLAAYAAIRLRAEFQTRRLKRRMPAPRTKGEAGGERAAVEETREDGAASFQGDLTAGREPPTKPADILSIARRLYPVGNPLERFLLLGRPLISPFHVLVDRVPRGSSILDVGCGNGLFINLLRYLGRISQGVGFDSSARAIRTAIAAAREYPNGGQARFCHLTVDDDWPSGSFDVVSMIDLLHHIPASAQRRAVEQALARVGPGGVFLFKDIGPRPAWRAVANRIHDLLLARQWVHYADLDDVAAWARRQGFVEERRETINMLWYGHELLVFRRSPGTN